MIPGSGRSLGEGNGNPLQHSCLENDTDRRVWWAIVHGVAKSWIRLSNHHTHTHTQTTLHYPIGHKEFIYQSFLSAFPFGLLLLQRLQAH